MFIHLRLNISEFRFNACDFSIHGFDVNAGFFIKGIGIAQDIEVEVVLAYFVKCRFAAVLVDYVPAAVRRDNLLNILSAQNILIFVYTAFDFLSNFTSKHILYFNYTIFCKFCQRG
jgi:hypothetical protein